MVRGRNGPRWGGRGGEGEIVGNETEEGAEEVAGFVDVFGIERAEVVRPAFG